MTWKTLSHPNVLPLLGVTMTENRLAVVSKWMVRGDVGGFIKANVNMDRLSLLKGVTRGLMYLHDKGVIHGDLNGMNVLIDNDGHACLTGFGLATIASTLPYAQPTDISIPWKSPELLFPVKFGLAESNPTKESDYYALAMVMYEILSGRAPFAASWNFQVAFLVLEGKRPERPQGDEGTLFIDEVWETLELCWKQRPCDRLSAEGVLTRLNELPAWPVGDPRGGWADTFRGGVRHLFQLRTQNDT